MTSECDAIGVHLAQLRQRPDLETTAVGEHRPGPFRKCVQPAQLLHAFCARPQHQVIGVAQDNIGAGLFNLVHIERLDRAGCTDGHEGRRANIAARRIQNTGARCAIAGMDVEIEDSH